MHATIGLEPHWYIGGYARMPGHVIAKLIASLQVPPSPSSSRWRCWTWDMALFAYFAVEETCRTSALDKIGSALAAKSQGDLTSVSA